MLEGTTINDTYLVEELIGEGRISMVYRAKNLEDNTRVALKCISPYFIPGPNTFAYLIAALERRQELEHPNIVKILDFGSYKETGEQSVLYIVLEYIEGMSLKQRIQRLYDEPITVGEILALLLQIAEALHFQQQNNIYANTLNPKKILLFDNKIKLPAFGFACNSQWIRDASRLSSTSGADYKYLAPDMVEANMIREGTQYSDTYLFGLLAFELGCATVPYEGNRELLIQLHKSDPVPDLLTESGLPTWYDKLVRNCLEKDPKNRPGLPRIIEALKTSQYNPKDLEITPSFQENPKIQVLFVEDNKLDQLSFSRYAKAAHYPFTFTLAHSKTQALQRLRTKKYDVVVSDYMLPDGTGAEIVKQASPLPVIILTGAGREEVAANALKSGAFDYLSKDMHHKHLRDLPDIVIRAFKHGQQLKEKISLEKKIDISDSHFRVQLSQEKIMGRIKPSLTECLSTLTDLKDSLDKPRKASQYCETLSSLLKQIKHHIDETNKDIEEESSDDTNEIALRPLIEDVITVLKNRHFSHVEFSIDEVHTDIAVSGDRTELSQVFYHLCQNACEAIGQRPGTVTIKMMTCDDQRTPEELTNKTDSEIRKNEFWALVCIEDSGPGIARELREQMFECFISNKNPEEHSGIGLTIVKNYIDKVGGHITVDSHPLQTNRIHIYLPITPLQEIDREAQESENANQVYI